MSTAITIIYLIGVVVTIIGAGFLAEKDDGSVCLWGPLTGIFWPPLLAVALALAPLLLLVIVGAVLRELVESKGAKK